MHLVSPVVLDDLIARLFQGTGPDRDLDLAIAEALEPTGLPEDKYNKPRKYTGSIDAALYLGRSIPGLNMAKLHHVAQDGVTETGPDFIPVFARRFCLEVVKTVKERQDALPIREKS